MGYRNTKYSNIGAIASNIRKLRELNNESQEQLASAISSKEHPISKSAISKIENEAAKLTIENSMLIAKHYETSIDWICGLTDDPSVPDNTIDVLLKYIKIVTHNIKFFRDHEIPYISIDKGFFDYLSVIEKAERLKRDNFHIDAITPWIEKERQIFLSKIRDNHFDNDEKPVELSLLPNNYLTDEVMDIIAAAYKTLNE